MMDRAPLLFALNATRELEDSEHKSRPLLSVRGRDVFILQSLLWGCRRGTCRPWRRGTA